MLLAREKFANIGSTFYFKYSNGSQPLVTSPGSNGTYVHVHGTTKLTLLQLVVCDEMVG